MAALIDTTNGDVLAMASIDGATRCNPPRPSRVRASTTRR